MVGKHARRPVILSFWTRQALLAMNILGLICMIGQPRGQTAVSKHVRWLTYDAYYDSKNFPS